MSAAALLDRLKAVRATGAGSWKARCPAHQDRRPSLSVKETGDGVVLVHCFSGCAVADVLGAVGLTSHELFPPRRPVDRQRRARAHCGITAAELLHFVDHESLLVLVAAARCIRDGSLQPADMARLETARARLEDVLRVLPR